MYFYGYAGTGKSTMVKVIQRIFRDSCGVLENLIEKEFGLDGLDRHLMLTGTELDERWRIEPTMFNKMVSGEEMSIPRKFKQAIQVTWRAPLLAAGNSIWVDQNNNGEDQLSRRLAVVKFGLQVPSEVSDSGLQDRMNRRLAPLVLKGALAFHALLRHCRNRSVYRCLPPYFDQVKRELNIDTSHMDRFLQQMAVDERVQLASKCGVSDARSFSIPVADLRSMFQAWAQDNMRGRKGGRNWENAVVARGLERAGIEPADAQGEDGRYFGVRLFPPVMRRPPPTGMSRGGGGGEAPPQFVHDPCGASEALPFL